jgi:hypothetical protein
LSSETLPENAVPKVATAIRGFAGHTMEEPLGDNQTFTDTSTLAIAAILNS